MSVPYLSAAWIAEADALLRAATIDPPVAEPGFSIETVVVPSGLGYIVELAGTGASARATRAGDNATVRFTQSSTVAAAVARGTMSAQEAFLRADIQVGGDVGTLIAHAGLIDRIGDVLGPLRADTTYPDET